MTDLDYRGMRELAENKNSIVDKRLKLLKELRKGNPVLIQLYYLISSSICFSFVQGIEMATFSTLSTSIVFLSGVIFSIIIESLQ